jgi:hypothetical protein
MQAALASVHSAALAVLIAAQHDFATMELRALRCATDEVARIAKAEAEREGTRPWLEVRCAECGSVLLRRCFYAHQMREELKKAGWKHVAEGGKDFCPKCKPRG